MGIGVDVATRRWWLDDVDLEKGEADAFFSVLFVLGRPALGATCTATIVVLIVVLIQPVGLCCFQFELVPIQLCLHVEHCNFIHSEEKIK